MYIYKTISAHTIEGLKKVEALKADGWQIVRESFFLIVFRRLEV